MCIINWKFIIAIYKFIKKSKKLLHFFCKYAIIFECLKDGVWLSWQSAWFGTMRSHVRFVSPRPSKLNNIFDSEVLDFAILFTNSKVIGYYNHRLCLCRGGSGSYYEITRFWGTSPTSCACEVGQVLIFLKFPTHQNCQKLVAVLNQNLEKLLGVQAGRSRMNY